MTMPLRRIALLGRELMLPLLLLLLLNAGPAQANPQGGSVTQGSATFTTSGPKLTVQTSTLTAINWQSFNIAANETTVFVQPTANSVVWNCVNDPNPSQILGHLCANGYIVVQNSSGIVVGGEAAITAHGLILTTSPTPPPNLAGSGPFEFDAPPPTAKIVNYGRLATDTGGSVYLIASDIENGGTISTPGGGVGLYAGKQVLLSERPDGRGLSAEVNLPSGSVDNSGKIIADAGTIALNAQVVNQGGLIQADSVQDENGVIELTAGDSLSLGASSTISAKGDSQGASSGGSVTIKSENTFSDASGSVVDVSGGAQGGNGGQVEISAPAMEGLNTQINGNAAAGWTGGTLSLDPLNITLSSSGSSAPGSGMVNSGDSPANGTLTLNINTFSGMSYIDLQATQNIEVSTGWTLANSINAATLTLQAGGAISVDQGEFISAGQNWTVNLFAGVNFLGTGYPVQAGVGTVTLSIANSLTPSYVQTANGNLNVVAGQSVSVFNGALRTAGGGNVSVTAMSGDVIIDDSVNNTGSVNMPPPNLIGYNNPFSAVPPYYTVSPSLSGISTEAGGNVNINAGLDVVAANPSFAGANNIYTQSYTSDAGSGAFDPNQPGIVTVTAGRNVTGHFVAADSVADGAPVASTITAGANAGLSGINNNLSLSLVRGGWQVNAPSGGIILEEVNNPNGMFDVAAHGTGDHLFDYAAQDFVDLNAYSVELTGSQAAFPRTSTDKSNQGFLVPTTYPSSLDIVAGAGGIQFDSGVTLFPSPYGELSIATTGGGSLNGGAVSSPDLVMSDMNPATWVPADGGNLGHAAVPEQLDNPNPVVLDISGNMNNFYLVTPKETEITVDGNMVNCSFQGQNLHSSDVTSINVHGQIENANSESFYTLSQPLSATVAAEIETDGKPNTTFLGMLIDANGNRIFGSFSPPGFFYNGGLVVGTSGQIGLNQYQALVNTDANLNPISAKPLYLQLYINSVPQINPVTGNPVPDLAHPITFLDSTVIAALYQESRNTAPYPLEGYQVGGPGTFKITAGSLDLGDSPGIGSQGPANNVAVAHLGPGAQIDVSVAQNLSMYSSTIASFFGGDIDITAGGGVDEGAEGVLSQSTSADGIYTVGGGNVNITAGGTINVAGSRIATLNGGNINLESLTGDVDAGNGAENNLTVTLYKFDAGGNLLNIIQTFPGSGIQAYTLPVLITGIDNVPTKHEVTLTESASDRPGNITIATPRGNINASAGGIIQLPLNGDQAPGPEITLSAGTHDGKAVIYPGNIDVSGAGVIGLTVNLDASGSILGFVFGRLGVNVTAVQNFSGTILSGGTADVSAGGVVAGTIVGTAGVDVTGGGTVEASLDSQNVSGGTSSLASTAVASTTSQSASQASTAEATAQTQTTTSDEDDLNKKGNRPLLAKTTGRVTVILPVNRAE
jgi:filamentous hemagglutinin family protein